MQARLTDMSVEDLAENTLYPRVLSIDDDNLFDFKVRYPGITYSHFH